MESMLVVALGWAFGGFVNGLAGFGAALVAMPLVAGRMDMATAVPSCTLIVLALNTQMGWSRRKHMAWDRVSPMLLGAVPGAALGVALLRSLPETALKTGMAGFIMAYAAWGLCRDAAPCGRLSRWWGGVAGLLAALFGAAFGFNGPPLVAYVSLAGWDKETAKAALRAGFVGTGAVMAAVQAAAGLYTGRAVLAALAATPAVLLGGHLGDRVSARLGERGYRKLVYVLLLAMGASILWGALRP